MEAIAVIGFAVVIYILLEIKNRVDRQSKVLEEQSEMLSSFEDKFSDIQDALTRIEAAIEVITPDSARVDELVRHGFDRGDAWEHLITNNKNNA